MLVEAGRSRPLSSRRRRVDPRHEVRKVNAELGEDRVRPGLATRDEAEQEVMGRDFLVVCAPGLPVGARQGSLAARIQTIDRGDHVRAPNDPRAGCRGDARRGRGGYVRPLLRQQLDHPVTDLFKAHPE